MAFKLKNDDKGASVIFSIFVRRKQNKSGSVSVQVIRKRDGKNQVVKTIGCSSDDSQITEMIQDAKLFIEQIEGKQRLKFINLEQTALFAKFENSINKMYFVVLRMGSSLSLRKG